MFWSKRSWFEAALNCKYDLPIDSDCAPEYGAGGSNGHNARKSSTGSHAEKGSYGSHGTRGSDGSHGTRGSDGGHGTKGSDGGHGTKGSDGGHGTRGSDGGHGTKGSDGGHGTRGSDGGHGTRGSDGSHGSKGSHGTGGSGATCGSHIDDYVCGGHDDCITCTPDPEGCIEVPENTTFVIDLNCGFPDAPAGTDLCDFRKTDGRPVALTLVYDFAGGIDQAENQRKASVRTIDDPEDGTVFIRVTNGKHVLFEGTVEEGDSFTVTADRKLPHHAVIKIYESDACSDLLQVIRFDASCAKPLALGDRFGSVTITGATFRSGRSVEMDSGEPTDDGVLYSIVGGEDGEFFTIDATTGVLEFDDDSVPDFEDPADAGGDNSYDLVVRVTDAGNPCKFVDKALQVCVTDDVDDDPRGPSIPASSSRRRATRPFRSC